MCLNPTIILNPRFTQYQHTFHTLVLNGSQIRQHPYDNMSYRCVVFRRKVDCSNYQKYYAIDNDGVCTPIYMAVPCNKCFECIESKRSALRTRMLLEQMSHQNCPQIFVTLTYNDENLPSDGVSREDVRRFLNRFHLYLGRAGFPTYFRHVFFSEYGSLHGRPHYHGLLYGINYLTDSMRLKFLEVLEKSWNKGFVYVKIVDGSVSSYVSKYVGKDVSFPIGDGKNPNFWTASRVDGGLGSLICKEDSFLELCSTPDFPTVNIPVDGRCYRVTLPAYIRDKVTPALRHFVPRHIRMAYIRYRKNLCLLEALTRFGDMNTYSFSTRTYAYEGRGSSRRLVRDYVTQFFHPDKDSAADFELFLRYTNYTRECCSRFDVLLEHYHISDFYWIDQFSHVSLEYFDLVKLDTQLHEDEQLLRSFEIDVSSVLCEVLNRRRISDRFVARLEKYQSSLPPIAERMRILRDKNGREFAMRVNDLQ